MTGSRTGPDVASDVWARPPLDPPLDTLTPVSGTAVPISVVPDRQDGSVDTFEPRGRWWTRNPLRVRLVAASVALVMFALVVIGTCSTIAMRSYLVGRMDNQIRAVANVVATTIPAHRGTPVVIVSTDEIEYGQLGPDGQWISSSMNVTASQDLPAVPDDAMLAAHLNQPFTISSQNGRYQYRMLLTDLPVQDPTTLRVGNLMLADNLSNVDSAIDRLVFIELLVGFAVLLAMGLASVWVVRASLRPLMAIERTAGAIAAGDLTQRVPELDPRTELGQLSAALNTMLNQIESAFQARAASERRAVRSEERMRQFVADASHELRTPLTTIRGFAELYRQGAAPEPADVLRRIEDEASRMGLLVEDLLMLARLDQERPLRLGPVALPLLIADAAAAAHAVAPDRTLEVELGDPTERWVVDGDEGRLRQVIGNLVTNALTHTPPGTPVALRLRADGPDHAVIEVSDRGPGLTPEQAEHVFERFYRVDKARTRRASTPAPRGEDALAAPHSGAGLGLAIVSALVAAHNGTVEVDTAPGQGATFRVRLPLAPAAV